jgi:hypothetical protein
LRGLLILPVGDAPAVESISGPLSQVDPRVEAPFLRAVPVSAITSLKVQKIRLFSTKRGVA